MNLGGSRPREGQFVMILLEAFEPNALPSYFKKKDIRSILLEERKKLNLINSQKEQQNNDMERI